MDPIHQFQINNLFTIGKIGNTEIAFTNSALYMLIALGVIALADARRDRPARAGARAACSRSPRCPTSSSPTRCAAAPAARA